MIDDDRMPLVLRQLATRLAYEGVPVRVIARSILQSAELVADSLDEALSVGEITEMPAADWPPTARRADRLPALVAKESDEKRLLCCEKIFKLTKLQANFMLVLLKHNEISKDTLHRVIEQQRSIRRNRPDNPEQTDPKMVDVVIWNIRRKLKVHNIAIVTLWGHGYYIPEPDRSYANTLMSEAAAGSVDGISVSK
jgi:hypothetical protein